MAARSRQEGHAEEELWKGIRRVGDGFVGGVGLGIGAGAPSLHAADDFPAGSVGRKNQGKKGPEENRQAVLAPTTQVAFGGGRQKFVGNGIRADGFEVAQGVGGFKLFECFGLFGFGTAAEEQRTEGRKNRSRVFHEKKMRIATHS